MEGQSKPLTEDGRKSAMREPSKAQDKTLKGWFQNIQHGQVKLPRFQRSDEAWDPKRITSFLGAIINGLPVGVALTLDVGDKEKFESRYIASVEPEEKDPVMHHLLDGQQRLTALWRALNNDYEKDTYFIRLPQLDKQKLTQFEDIEVHRQKRRIIKKGSRLPVWADDPAKCLQRDLFPTHLLCPGDKGRDNADEWIETALGLNPSEKKEIESYIHRMRTLESNINALRERVAYCNLPYLSLPSSTSKHVALQVFINMNTNSKPLSMYDIIVAEVEDKASESLHTMAERLDRKCPKATALSDAKNLDAKNLILTTSALLQKKMPSRKGMVEMDKQKLLDNWEKLEQSLGRMVSLLESQKIFDKARLPTSSVLPVVAAAYQQVPEHGDLAAKGERLLRAYLWSSFFTDRYESSAPSRAYADFIGIKELLCDLRAWDFDEKTLSAVPILDRKEHKLANMDALMKEGWPKKAGIKRRGILAVFNYFGADDFADGKSVAFENIGNREYHHIFPRGLFKKAGIATHHSDRVLNCALITRETNRSIGNEDPLDYLEKRVQWAGKQAVSGRLKTHLASFDLLSKAHYYGLDGEALKMKLELDFKQFMRHRAQLVHKAVVDLAEGKQPYLDSIWAEPSSEQTEEV